MKKFWTILTIISFAIMPAMAKPEKITFDITWELLPDGTLVIDGSGAMPNMDVHKPQYWQKKKYEGQIRSIVIGEGIIRIGADNFANAGAYKGNSMSSVKTIKLPSTLKHIGAKAFYGTGVENIEFGQNVETIGNMAFFYSDNLRSVKLPSSVTEINPNAFAYNTNLSSFDFSSAKAALGNKVFMNDKNLTQILNSENAYYESTGGVQTSNFDTVFAGTPLKESDVKLGHKPGEDAEDIMISDIVAKNLKINKSSVPEGVWEADFRDGGIIYGWGTLKIANNDANCKTPQGISSPYGFYCYQGEEGIEEYVFEDMHQEEDITIFKARPVLVYENQMPNGSFATELKPSDEISEGWVRPNADKSLDFKLDNIEIHFLNPDRQRYVVVLYGDDPKIVKSPGSNAVISRADKGEIFPFVSEKTIESDNMIVTWYCIKLKDGSTGYISGFYADMAYDDNGEDVTKTDDMIFDEDATFSAEIKDYDENPVGSRGLTFKRLGDKVLVSANEIYLNGRIYGNYYGIGHIAGNAIVIEKSLYEQGGVVGAEEAYLNGDYNKLINLMSPDNLEEGGDFYWYDGNIYWNNTEYN